MSSLSQEKVQETLKQVQDPELNRSIVALGMVKEIRITGNDVTVDLSVTSQSPQIKEEVKKRVEEALRSIPEAKEVVARLSTPAPRGPSFSNKQSIPGINHVIAIASGKGGVGKSTVAANLAIALTQKGMKVGLMDGDIYGPNIPLMLGIPSETRPRVDGQDKMIPIEAHGVKAISMGVLVPPDQPMVWRGPMLHGAVTQFLQKVSWGELDFLLVDLPPGTGDVQLSLVQTTPLAGAVIVTTPQEVALMDVRKGIAMFQKTEVPILGVIENMTGDVFGSGGGRKAAEQYKVPFLGEVPLEGRIREGGDQGKPIASSDKNHAATKAFLEAAEKLLETMKVGSV